MKKILLAIGIISAQYCFAQDEPEEEPETTTRTIMTLGGDIYSYPFGYVVNVRYEQAIGWNDAININFGYNALRYYLSYTKEYGHGPGGTLGYRHYFRWGLKKIFAGGSLGFWRNTTNWEGSSYTTSGTGHAVTLHFLFETGYGVSLKNLPIGIAPYFVIGGRMDLKKTGEAVGQGFVCGLGCSINYRIEKHNVPVP